ncbi:MAG: hypothetical protein A3H96_27240 [Acidobacteria bacterium RIFCSPLOWO2_02_FULL_67_36]|nr:MAG: hypothetical protein A3H96_27240 [Acidobacteria bacterium RIFCSPLOWO2_02_FULL_67_36]OFW24560.1 MAG: hypothetical protein A3G21_18585 [Acidobacteria bacterium RIFCSPLOWO2_12_FULL_66_21]
MKRWRLASGIVIAGALVLPVLGAEPRVGSVAQDGTPDERAHRAAKAGKTREAFDLVWSALQELPSPAPEGLELHLRRDVLTWGNRAWRVSEESERRVYRAMIAIRDAKDEDGYWEAERELHGAVRASPWSAEATYNLALALAKVGLFHLAAQNMKLYLDYLSESDGLQQLEALRGKMWEWQYQHDRGKGKTRLVWRVENACKRAVGIEFRDFAGLIWPGEDRWWTLDPGKAFVVPTVCAAGTRVCYGALETKGRAFLGPRKWGIGTWGDRWCKDCCYPCTTGNSANFLTVRLACD